MNSLVNYGASSDESDVNSEIETDNEKKHTEAEISGSKLPKPDFDGISSSYSVFTNPFVEAEHKEIAILEKHVKMVSTKSPLINGKKICWNYRKGRCRFGHNCKFAHDSDLQQTDEVSDSTVLKQEQMSQSSSISIVSSTYEDCSSTQDEQEDHWEENVNKCKQKRPGLSQNIVPGKKVLNIYKRQKITEIKR